MPSKLVIALALSPAAALQLPGVGEVALKLPHRSSVLRDAISQFAAAQSALEAVFRPPPPRAATHSISDVRKREIQEGRARPRRALARTKIPAAQRDTRPRAHASACRAHTAHASRQDAEPAKRALTSRAPPAHAPSRAPPPSEDVAADHARIRAPPRAPPQSPFRAARAFPTMGWLALGERL